MVITLIRIAFLSLLITCTCSIAGEVSFSAGIQHHSAKTNTNDPVIDNDNQSDSGYHFGFSMKNQYGDKSQHFFGVGVDIDEILGDRLIGYRALDYERSITPHLRLGAFFGAASLDSGLPQNGYYTGVSITYMDIMDHLGLSFEIRHGNGLARDRITNETQNEQPDIFLDFTAAALQLRWTF